MLRYINTWCSEGILLDVPANDGRGGAKDVRAEYSKSFPSLFSLLLLPSLFSLLLLFSSFSLLSSPFSPIISPFFPLFSPFSPLPSLLFLLPYILLPLSTSGSHHPHFFFLYSHLVFVVIIYNSCASLSFLRQISYLLLSFLLMYSKCCIDWNPLPIHLIVSCLLPQVTATCPCQISYTILSYPPLWFICLFPSTVYVQEWCQYNGRHGPLWNPLSICKWSEVKLLHLIPPSLPPSIPHPLCLNSEEQLIVRHTVHILLHLAWFYSFFFVVVVVFSSLLSSAQLNSGLLYFVVSSFTMSRSLHYNLSLLLLSSPPLTSVLYGMVRYDTVYQDIAAAEKKKKLLARKQKNIEQAQEERKRKAADWNH